MAQDHGNSSMEMGTSDQVLVARKKSRKTRYAIGFVAMLIAIGVVITLVVVLSGNEGASPPIPGPIITTEGPTFPTTISTTTPTPTTTTSTTTEAPTTLLPPPPEIELEDIINGEFSSPSFNGTWVSGSEILFRDYNGHLMLYDVDTESATTLISNDSQILQQSFRVTSLSPDGNYVVLSYNEVSVYRHSFNARYTAVDLHTGQEIHIYPPGVAPENATLQNFVWGPTGTSLAFVYGNNIFFRHNLTTTSLPVQLTTTGLENVVYHGVPDWVYEEEVFGSNNAIWFSSDGAKLAYATFNDTKVRVMKIPYFGVPGSVEYQYTRHREIHYPKSGTTNPTVSVTIRDIASNADTTFNVPTDLDEPILKTVLFVGNDIAVMWTNRVQTSLRIDICVEAIQTVPATCNAIFRHTENDGWIDSNPLLFNTQGNAFITILPAAVDGVRYKQIVQVTRPVNVAGLWSLSNRVNTAHTVGEILLWTDEDVIWYKATGVTDRAEQHIYTVNSSGDVSCFTCNIKRPDGKQCLFNDAAISSGSRISVNCGGPEIPQILIYDKNGTLLSVWDDNSRVTDLLASHTMPVTIHHTIRGVAAIEADVMIQVPPDYATRTNLPLLVYVYAGPDTALVTKQWTLDWGTSLVSRYGIAVARIDGRGSGLRGVDNMFAVNRKLGTVEIEDQIAVTRILHQNLQWLDSNRTCIWGWSYGGYAASLALARGGDVFRCAIAVAPVVDWRYYDTIYTERYMDTPQNNIVGYANSSLLTEDVVEAYRNKSYFLVHGTEDDNVHYQHAMLISRLLQRKDVYFHQMSYTDEDHGLGGVRPHLYHALEKFLQENMF